MDTWRLPVYKIKCGVKTYYLYILFDTSIIHSTAIRLCYKIVVRLLIGHPHIIQLRPIRQIIISNLGEGCFY